MFDENRCPVPRRATAAAPAAASASLLLQHATHVCMCVPSTTHALHVAWDMRSQ